MNESARRRKRIIIAIIAVAGVAIIGFSAFALSRWPASGYTCPSQMVTSSLVDAQGFAVNIERNKGTNALHELVLPAGSTGSLSIVYGPRSNATTVQETIMNLYHVAPSDYFKPIENLHKVNGMNPPTAVSAEKAGVQIVPTGVEQMGQGSLKVHYNVTVDNSAEKATYLAGFWQTCPGELITVGESQHSGSLPWDSGLFS
jgi:hypothetical protein